MSSNSMVNGDVAVRRRDSDVDRISNLPEGIIEKILCRLPIREVAKTSMLSKPWRYKWLSIPNLDFNWSFEELLYDENFHFNPMSFATRVLTTRHKAPILKFSFSCEAAAADAFSIQLWLKLLSYHPIEEFTLLQDPEEGQEEVPRHLLPQHLFSFDRLKKLNLSSVAIRLPPVFRGFPRLLKLYLHSIDIDSKDLNIFVSKCPALKVFYLFDCCDEARILVFDAPNLKVFKFQGKFKSFVGSKNIQELSIWPVNTSDGNGGGDGDGLLPVDGSNLVKFFDQFPFVRKLDIGKNFLMLLAKGGVPNMLPNYVSRLTTLELGGFDFGSMVHVTCLLCLIRSSPNLQSLEIGADRVNDGAIHNGMEGEEPAVIEYLKAQETCEFSHGHIKTIKMNWFRGLKAELAFVKVVLLKSVLLRELGIRFPRRHDPTQVSQVKIALEGFLKASSVAVVEYLDPFPF